MHGVAFLTTRSFPWTPDVVEHDQPFPLCTLDVHASGLEESSISPYLLGTTTPSGSGRCLTWLHWPRHSQACSMQLVHLRAAPFQTRCLRCITRDIQHKTVDFKTHQSPGTLHIDLRQAGLAEGYPTLVSPPPNPSHLHSWPCN